MRASIPIRSRALRLLCVAGVVVPPILTGCGFAFAGCPYRVESVEIIRDAASPYSHREIEIAIRNMSSQRIISVELSYFIDGGVHDRSTAVTATANVDLDPGETRRVAVELRGGGWYGVLDGSTVRDLHLYSVGFADGAIWRDHLCGFIIPVAIPVDP